MNDVKKNESAVLKAGVFLKYYQLTGAGGGIIIKAKRREFDT